MHQQKIAVPGVEWGPTSLGPMLGQSPTQGYHKASSEQPPYMRNRHGSLEPPW